MVLYRVLKNFVLSPPSLNLLNFLFPTVPQSFVAPEKVEDRLLRRLSDSVSSGVEGDARMKKILFYFLLVFMSKDVWRVKSSSIVDREFLELFEGAYSFPF